jgi:hypothetical protein
MEKAVAKRLMPRRMTGVIVAGLLGAATMSAASATTYPVGSAVAIAMSCLPDRRNAPSVTT